MVNSSLSIYYCVDRSGGTVETCFESVASKVGDLGEIIDEDSDDDFAFQDGACCEGLRNQSAICCIIELNRAVAFRYVPISISYLPFIFELEPNV